MRFTSNDTIEKRAVDKTLGFIKHVLMNKQGLQVNEVKIMRQEEIVKIKGRGVAAMSAERQVVYDDEIKDIKGEVEKLLQTWKEKRSIE